MTYIVRNKNKIIMVTALALLVVSILIVWFQKKFFNTVGDIDCTVYPAKLYVGDTLFYKDNTDYVAIKKWEFGDGNLSVSDQGYYFYKDPGFYQVTFTINDKYSKSFPIEVLEKKRNNQGDHFTTIEAPMEAMQYENVVFRANTKTATLYSWKFGETGSIDAKEPLVIYAYQQPGNYEVTLFTDDTAYPVIHHITVLPSFKNLNESLEVADVYKQIDDDFKYHLQQIANGSNFNEHYNYLVNKYLCQKENAAVRVNDSKLNSFYYYCMGLRFDKDIQIQEVKVGFDEELNCVTKLNIVQSKS